MNSHFLAGPKMRAGIALLSLVPLLAQRPNPGPSPSPDPAMEAALKALMPVTSGVREDDHPALAVRNGRAWVAWVSYSETEGTSHVYAASFEGAKWSEPAQVTEIAGDYHKPAIAVDGNNAVWVAWPAQVRGNWDIYARALRGKTWSKTERLTTDAAADVSPQLAAAGSRVLLVWQSMRGKSLDILYRLHSNSWGKEGFVTENAANDWEPVVAASPKEDVFYVAWDSYRGDYDVFLRTLAGTTWSAEIPVAASSRLENHASLFVDASERAWITWETGPEAWASDSADGGLRPRREIGFACYQNGKLYTSPDAQAALAKLAGKAGMEAGSIAVAADGQLRLFFRTARNVNWLNVQSTVWEPGSWRKPEPILNSEGRIDQRIVAANLGSRVLAVYPAGSAHNTVYAQLFEPAGSTPPLTPAPPLTAKAAPPPPSRHVLNGYQLVWGDLHRHTDISEDGGTNDGSLMDTMRYSADAAGLDFIGVTDHTRYLPRRYNLWRIQQISDLYYKPGVFSPMHAYERSQYSPWGHRNIVHLNRDYTPVPGSYDIGDTGVSPDGLFRMLKGKKALSIPHTSAWANKQVSWEYNDPDIERVVEIYQGLRSTYEYNGAPDPAGRAIYEKDSKNFIWNALEKKLKLGFIASSDHRSTHMSFAAVYVKTLDRDGIFEGLRARRTYASTDKILVDFRIGSALMGEETVVAGIPELTVAVKGTAAISKIDIVKNGKFVYSTDKSQFTFRDEGYAGEECYYYVRVIQTDKNMAWASPIWVRR
ncbi:MAG: hypothetical protein EXQ52_03135 [Bryobacterales bacterium]|nr:hypothetical protein [Bryobacterales bacterium]